MRSPLPLQALLPLLALAAACSGKEEEDTAPPLALDDTGEVACTGADPVITEVTITNGGFHMFEGEKLPTVLLAVTATDADSDLDVMSADWWWETPPDGEVITERSPDSDGAPTQTRDLECGVASATLYLYIPMKEDGFLEPNTEYEAAAIVTDAHGLTSEKGIGSGWTPNLDGTDGGPE